MRYYFYITDGRYSLSDDYGTECQTEEEVKAEAEKAWEETISAATDGTDWEGWYVSVLDADGNVAGCFFFN